MAKLSKSPNPYEALNEPDPYLEIEDEFPRLRDAKESLSSFTPKAKDRATSPSFEPNVIKSLAAAIGKLSSKISDIPTSPKVPNITVEAPKVTVQAPEVNITQKTPKRLRFTVTDRDEMGRIKDITVTVLE